jgi:hypothetical protein
MKCPVLFIVFNRPDSTRIVFNSICKSKPYRLYIAADGPRKNIHKEAEKCNDVRCISTSVDWNCEVFTLFRTENLGCKKAVSSAIDWFFKNEEMGIIIEDDCNPTSGFFDFCEWGLEEYKNNKTVGMISGSNLVDYKYDSIYRNGYSRYINIWGWATWRDRWLLYNSNYSLTDISQLNQEMKNKTWILPLERFYWKNIFKHTFSFQTTWDFYLQYLFFKNKYLSVYPSSNLVKNIGYDGDGTHTNVKQPKFYMKSMPKGYNDIMNKPALLSYYVDEKRDHDLLKIVWGCGYYKALKLFLMNIIRYIKV